MRILFWSIGFWPSIGGVEVLAARLLPALQECGHEFAVVAPQSTDDRSEESYYRGIPVYRFPFRDVTSYTDIDRLMHTRRRVAALKRAFAPDLVHINSVDFGCFFHNTTTKAHVASSLVTLHGGWLSLGAGQNSIVEHTLRAADWVVGCSAAALDKGRRLVPGIIPHSSVIYNGVVPPSLTPEPLSFDGPRLLYLGRLSSEKGVDLALGALASIADRFPDLRMVVAGDGLARPELERQAADLGLEGAVHFVGSVAPDEVPSLINAATLVLLPSRQEGFGLAALEAASMARPVVATNVGGLPEVVVHRETGLLVEPDDRDALAEAVAFLLDRPELAARMGRAARRRAEEVFSWDRQVDAYDALYRRLAKGRRRSSSAPLQQDEIASMDGVSSVARE